jgi:glucose/arabinose dehydrogenase
MVGKYLTFALVLALTGGGVVACGDDDGASSSGTGGTSTGGGNGTGGQGGAPTTLPTPNTENFDCSEAAGGAPAVAPALQLTEVASGLSRPVFLTYAPGETDERLFVVEQSGLIKIIEDGTVLDTPFLDATSQTTRGGGDERGLLGLAFHPDYEENGLLYIYHTRGDGDSNQNVIAEYKVSDDPNVVDPESRRDVLVIDDFANNHNGGTIAFGGDGFLYFGSGDGGGGGDPQDNGQNVGALLGKILRIDVDSRDSGAYGIPPGNLKEENGNAAPEVWDYGLRNPYRFGFDGCTGDLYIGDVGQGTAEEINIEPPLSGHRNYGWSVTEGNDCYNASDCDKSGITFPVTTRPTSSAGAILGGYVYRGANIPGLRGTYFYGELVTGDIYTLRWDGTTANDVQKASIGVDAALYSFGQDGNGEIYVLESAGDTDGAGTVYRIDPQ